jgi:hypothetical protein
MAAMAGTVREVVGRSLKALEVEGAIKVDRHRIIITDKELCKNNGGALLRQKSQTGGTFTFKINQHGD